MPPTGNVRCSEGQESLAEALIPPKQKARKIEIMPAENGVIVTVGCNIFVSNDIEEVCKNIIEYYKNPAKKEKEFMGKKDKK